MRSTGRVVASALLLLGALLQLSSSSGGAHAASVLAIDYGTHSFKACLLEPGAGFDVLLNRDSKRKTPSAVGFKDGLAKLAAQAESLVRALFGCGDVSLMVLSRLRERPRTRLLASSCSPAAAAAAARARTRARTTMHEHGCLRACTLTTLDPTGRGTRSCSRCSCRSPARWRSKRARRRAPTLTTRSRTPSSRSRVGTATKSESRSRTRSNLPA